MASTPRSAAAGLALTRPISRPSRSPRTPQLQAQQNGSSSNSGASGYVSFPTPAQMAADRSAAASRSSDADAFDPAAKLSKSGPVNRTALAWSCATCVASTPSLCGICCWPSLVAAIAGGTVTAATRELSHTLSFVAIALVMTAMLAYFFHATRARAQMHDSHMAVYGPLYLLSIASALVLLDPLRHVLQDSGAWASPSAEMFRVGCTGEGWKCLSTTGQLCALASILGFLAMFTAAAWNGNLLSRTRSGVKEWQDMRQARAAAELARANQAREDAWRSREEAARARTAAIAASVAAKPPSFSFGDVHLAMSPPAFLYRAEEANRHSRVGHIIAGGAAAASAGNGYSRRGEDSQLSTSSSAVMSPATGSPNSTIAADVAAQQAQDAAVAARVSPAEYAAEGFSFETGVPAEGERVIRVGASNSRTTVSPPRSTSSSSSAATRGVTVPGAASPTVLTVSGSPSINSGTHQQQQQAHGTHYLHAAYPSPVSSVGAMSSCSFADIALTPNSKLVADSLASPPPAKYARSHVPGELLSPASTTGISPRAGPTVKQKFEDLRAAASPFDKQKWQQQQQQQRQAEHGPV